MSRWIFAQNEELPGPIMRSASAFRRWIDLAYLRFRTSRLTVAAEVCFARQDNAEWRWETEPPGPAERLCVFVTYASNGNIPERAVRHAQIWRDAGYTIVFVIAIDDFSAHPTIPFGHAICRQNAGHDFAAWSRALTELPLGDARFVATVNDSVFAKPGLTAAIRRAEDMPADVVGFTESREIRWHVQSYAVLFKQRCIQSRAFAKFWTPRLGAREHVIRTYEIPLAGTMKAAGFTVAVLYPSSSKSNPTVDSWPELAEQGFPYLKRSSLPLSYTEWRDVIIAQGFDLALIDAEKP